MRPGAAERTLAAPSASSGDAEHHRRTNVDPGNDTGRGFRPLLEDLLDQGRRQAPAARIEGRDRLPRSRTRPTASGCSSTGTRAGWQSFVSDPEVPGIMQEAGHKGRPQASQTKSPTNINNRKYIATPYRRSQRDQPVGCSTTGSPRVGRASSPTPRCPGIMQEAGHKGRPGGGDRRPVRRLTDRVNRVGAPRKRGPRHVEGSSSGNC